MISTREIVVTPDERTMGTLAHVLQLVGGWIGPLVLFFVKRESKFVSFHALQVLLLHIFYTAFWMLMMVAWVAIIFGTLASRASTGHMQQFPATFFMFMPVFWLAAMGGWVVLLILAIVYGIKANQGEWARYPVVGNWAARILKIEIAG